MSKVLYSLASLRALIRKEHISGLYLVTSKSLARRFPSVIREMGILPKNVILLPDGEKAKEWDEVGKLIRSFNRLNVDRDSIVLAFGGGTIGDTVGFATSIYLRGIRFVQIPTTLLAQVDSAHGGKTGVNFLGYKNQIGVFHLPLAVAVDKRFTSSLPEELVVDGLGEIIKAGFIHDPSILSLLKKETVKSLPKSRRLSEIIRKTIQVKTYYTERDFKDQLLRQILNVGHTVGHAIELKYGISHGRAVLAGTLKELQVSESLKLTRRGTYEAFEELLESLGIRIDRRMKADWKIILHDKKISGEYLLFPTVTAIGKAKVVKIPLQRFKKALGR